MNVQIEENYDAYDYVGEAGVEDEICENIELKFQGSIIKIKEPTKKHGGTRLLNSIRFFFFFFLI